MSLAGDIAHYRAEGGTDEEVARKLNLLCKAPDCRKPLDLDRVLKKGAETCDDKCRARAWKAEKDYGRHDRPTDTPRTRANGRTRPNTSGLQVSYPKAVQVLAAKLAIPVDDAREILAGALSEKQRQRLEARS